MNIKTIDFKDVAEGVTFSYKGKQYKKIPPVKVSCCTTLNAIETNETNNKIMVRPLEMVEVYEHQ